MLLLVKIMSSLLPLYLGNCVSHRLPSVHVSSRSEIKLNQNLVTHMTKFIYKETKVKMN